MLIKTLHFQHSGQLWGASTNSSSNKRYDFFLSDFGESACITMTSPPTSQPPEPTPHTSRRKRKIEDIIESVNNDFKKVASLAENVLMGGRDKSAIHLIFESLAVQAEGANLTCMELSELQIQMCQTFHNFLQNTKTIFAC